MRVYISVDMEGATGVTHPQDVIPGRSQFERFRPLLTADVNAAIEVAAAAGATEFLVNEAHDGMRNVLIDELDERAELIVGSRKPFFVSGGTRSPGRRDRLRRVPRRASFTVMGDTLA